MSRAGELAAQAWCKPETSHITMDVALAQAVLQQIEVAVREAAEVAYGLDFLSSSAILRHFGLEDEP